MIPLIISLNINVYVNPFFYFKTKNYEVWKNSVLFKPIIEQSVSFINRYGRKHSLKTKTKRRPDKRQKLAKLHGICANWKIT